MEIALETVPVTTKNSGVSFSSRQWNRREQETLRMSSYQVQAASDVKTSNALSRKDKMKFLYLKCL